MADERSIKWWFKKGGIVAGPVDFSCLQDLAKKRRISSKTMVRCGENGEWIPASDVGIFVEAEEDIPTLEPRGEVLNLIIQNDELQFCCPFCRQRYTAPLALLNTETVCQKCNKTMRIAEAPSASAKKADVPPETTASVMPGMEIVSGDLTCPHCWQSFSRAHLLYISSHPELLGDPVAGQTEQIRFLPTVYNAHGLPLDTRGMVCTDMACPRCHLRIPSTVVDMPSLYFSIVGAPGSGKSYWLTAITYRLKNLLGTKFNLSFADADPSINAVIDGYEQILFLNTHQEKTSSLPQVRTSAAGEKLAILPKTQQAGIGFSSSVMLNGMPVDLPKPYVYTLTPLPSYQGTLPPEKIHCNMVLYDNAGEHFHPGNDVVFNPATKHLVHSNGIFFIFDPTEDAVMRQHCDPEDPQVTMEKTVNDQAILMMEMIARIRRHGNMKAHETSSIPLVILVAKYDTWKNGFDYELNNIPYLSEDPELFTSVLDMDAVLNVSFHLRSLLLKTVPRIVTSAEAFFDSVVFLPVSVFGRIARKNEQGIGVRWNEISPIWLDTSMLYMLSKLNMLPSSRGNNAAAPLPNCRIAHNAIQFQMPEAGTRIQLPLEYAGAVIEFQGQRFQLPQLPRNGDINNKNKTVQTDFWS